MRMDTPVANGDPTLARLVPEGVTLVHIVRLFLTAYPVNGEQLLCAQLGALGATHPENIAPPKLAEFIEGLLRAIKSAGIRDPAGSLAHEVQREAEAAAAKLASSPEAEPPEARSTKSANEVGTSGESDVPLPTPGENKRLPDKPATNTTPRIANAKATTTAGDEIIIDGRRFLSESGVAEMLGYSLRQVQRWRTEQKGKGPPSTPIGDRRFFYEISKVQEWIDRRTSR